MSCNCACYTISANFGVQSYVTLLILSLILYKQAPVNETSALWSHMELFLLWFFRQCGSLWVSLSGRHTIVPMTISRLGMILCLNPKAGGLLCSVLSFLDSRFHFHGSLYSLVRVDLIKWNIHMISGRSMLRKSSTEVETKPSKLVECVKLYMSCGAYLVALHSTIPSTAE